MMLKVSMLDRCWIIDDVDIVDDFEDVDDVDIVDDTDIYRWCWYCWYCDTVLIWYWWCWYCWWLDIVLVVIVVIYTVISISVKINVWIYKDRYI